MNHHNGVLWPINNYGHFGCIRMSKSSSSTLKKEKDLMGIKKIMKKWNGPFYDNEGSDNPSHRGDWQHLRYSHRIWWKNKIFENVKVSLIYNLNHQHNLFSGQTSLQYAAFSYHFNEKWKAMEMFLILLCDLQWQCSCTVEPKLQFVRQICQKVITNLSVLLESFSVLICTLLKCHF